MLIKKSKKWVNMSFPDHSVNRKLVDNVENYLNMQFQQKVMPRSQENGQKPIFWKIAYKKNLRVFLENRASSLFYIYNGLTSCNVSEKTNDGKYENFLLRTDGQTDRRSWIHKDSWRVLKRYTKDHQKTLKRSQKKSFKRSSKDDLQKGPKRLSKDPHKVPQKVPQKILRRFSKGPQKVILVKVFRAHLVSHRHLPCLLPCTAIDCLWRTGITTVSHQCTHTTLLLQHYTHGCAQCLWRREFQSEMIQKFPIPTNFYVSDSFWWHCSVLLELSDLWGPS